MPENIFTVGLLQGPIRSSDLGMSLSRKHSLFLALVNLVWFLRMISGSLRIICGGLMNSDEFPLGAIEQELHWSINGSSISYS